MSLKDYMSSADLFEERISNLWQQLAPLPNKHVMMDTALSNDDVFYLFDEMPNNFAITHRVAFNSAADLSLNKFTKWKEQRLETILYSAPMKWLKKTHPVVCSQILPELVDKLGPTAKSKLDVVTHLLSGEFSKTLLKDHPFDCLKMANQLWTQLEEGEIEQLLAPQLITTQDSAITHSDGSSLPTTQHVILMRPQAGINLPPMLQLIDIPCDKSQRIPAKYDICILTPELIKKYDLQGQTSAPEPNNSVG